jgi:hypothetical protein
MSAPVWCADLATAFWDAAGPPPPFPRDLRPVIAATLPVSVVTLPQLSVAAVCAWFAGRGIAVPLDEPDRPLRACLVAWLGQGFAFVEATDDPAERRFSVAHELGHFLRDYWQPRRRAVARLGPGVRQVLDGLRPATPDERLHAILRGVPLGSFTHLLRRDDSGRPLSAAERESESAADRLAFELLAPAAALSLRAGRAALTERLVTEFGLPPGPARRYAALLAPEPAARDGLMARLLRS